MDTIILTTEHAASSYGRPVLVIEGDAFGPADLTPAGITGAELVNEWAAKFGGQQVDPLSEALKRARALPVEFHAQLADITSLWCATLEKIFGSANGPAWPEPTTARPSAEELESWQDDGGCEATDGCWVEADGVCEHGHPAWSLRLGLV